MEDFFHSFFICDVIGNPFPRKKFEITALGEALVQKQDHAAVIHGADDASARLKHFVDTGIQIGVREAAAVDGVIILFK